MSINTLLPSELLRPFIRTYIIVECADEMVNNVLPDTSLVMAFRFKGRLTYTVDTVENSLPSASISGLRKSKRAYNYSKDTGNILVLFKEASVTAFFKEPLHEIFDETISLDNFMNSGDLLMIEEQLSEATNNHKRVALIEQLLLTKLYDHRVDQLVLAAVDKIHSAKGMVRIKELASSLYISQDAFEKRFRRAVGASPKQFASTIRMESVIANRGKGTLTSKALDAGYFDQPHFNKDFRLFTGQSPTDFFKSPSVLQINDFLQ